MCVGLLASATLLTIWGFNDSSDMRNNDSVYIALNN